jgi:hypothetical protein
MKTDPANVTAAEISCVLKKERHAGSAWVTIDEMRCGIGFGRSERSIDLWAIEASNPKGCPAIAYEIKISRADFRRDMKDPEKQRGALTFSNRFYFVAPVGVIPRDELPAWAGLIEVFPEQDGEKRSRISVHAYPRDKCAPSWSLLMAILRRVKPDEEVVSGYKGSSGGAHRRFDDPVDALTLECLIDDKVAKLERLNQND